MNWGKWFSGGQYFAIKNISFKTPILRSDLCHYSGAKTVLKETITVTGTTFMNTADIHEYFSI